MFDMIVLIVGSSVARCPFLAARSSTFTVCVPPVPVNVKLPAIADGLRIVR
jgi:hypothetical protein